MQITHSRLAEKGWSDEEIEKTMDLLEKARQNRHPYIFLLDKIVYWMALVLIIVGNFTFSFILIPLLITFNNFSLYFIILLLSATFGIIMSVVIKDIEHLEVKHHVTLLLVVPIVGIINFFFVVKATNNDIMANVLQIYHNPWIIGIIYLAGFLIPYIYLVFEEKWMR